MSLEVLGQWATQVAEKVARLILCKAIGSLLAFGLIVPAPCPFPQEPAADETLNNLSSVTIDFFRFRSEEGKVKLLSAQALCLIIGKAAGRLPGFNAFGARTSERISRFTDCDGFEILNSVQVLFEPTCFIFLGRFEGVRFIIANGITFGVVVVIVAWKLANRFILNGGSYGRSRVLCRLLPFLDREMSVVIVAFGTDTGYAHRSMLSVGSYTEHASMCMLSVGSYTDHASMCMLSVASTFFEGVFQILIGRIYNVSSCLFAHLGCKLQPGRHFFAA